ncbi:MAG: DUF368 domain-containing protein [Eubacteriales bacterium]|jgi:putative membrane protein|nr:DUF368 domain-containing protein [Eubacteriales bacterium]MDD4711685.1 DUF368 domain-containing protein [Eubacteriales bacterium]
MSNIPEGKNPLSLILLRVVSGILIGGGAILPGVSGGVLAVVFGIYRPMMELLSHPFKAFSKYWKLFLPVGIGVVLGFVGFAKVVGTLFQRYETQMLWLFIGLILGTIPMLLKNARQEGKTRRQDVLSLIIAFAVLVAFLLVINRAGRLSIALTPVWAFISGIVWGFSLVVPGLSSSSILIFMGLYESIMTAAGVLDLAVVLPLVLGIAVVALLFARLVDRLFNKHYGIASHAVIGLVLASTFGIIPPVKDALSLFGGLGLAVLGFIIAVVLDRWQNQVKPKD